VLLCFPCIKPIPPVFFLCSTASSSPPSCHCFFEPEVSLTNPLLLWRSAFEPRMWEPCELSSGLVCPLSFLARATLLRRPAVV
jgi:hypothetical protein